jgi:hypothetical protein
MAVPRVERGEGECNYQCALAPGGRHFVLFYTLRVFFAAEKNWGDVGDGIDGF